VNQHEWQDSGKLRDVPNDEIEVQLMVYILPTVVIIIDSIGGPYVGFKPFIEGVVTFDETSADSCASVTVALNWGLQVSIGAKIDILHIYNYTTDPETIYSVKKPIASGCISSETAIVTPGVPFVGTIWAGIFNNDPKCPLPSGDVAFQLFEFDAQNPSAFVFIGSYNVQTPHNGHCVIQSKFNCSPDELGGGFVCQPVLNENGEEVLFENCEIGKPLKATGWYGQFSSDWSTVTVTTQVPDGCQPPILYRQQQN